MSRIISRSTPEPNGSYLKFMKPLIVLSAVDQVVEHLRRAILRGELAGTMPGAHPLAEDLGVNHKTVKAALLELEQEGLLVRQGSGLGRRIVLPEGSAPPSLRIAMLSFSPPAQGHIYQIDLRHRLDVAGHVSFNTDKCLVDLGREPGRVARYVAKTEADAWIVGAASREVLEWFAGQEAPAFALFGVREGLPIAATGPDKGPALAGLTRRLIALGHRRIAFIVRREHREPEPSPPIRSYLGELEAAGLATGEFNLPGWEESREGFKGLLDSLFGGLTPPTALILDEAFQFHASYHYLSRRGLKVPDDVSLICSDEDPGFEWCQPAVSHIRWDYRPVARRVVRWANNVARGKNDRRQTLAQAEFVEGGTVGPACSG